MQGVSIIGTCLVSTITEIIKLIPKSNLFVSSGLAVGTFQYSAREPFSSLDTFMGRTADGLET